MFVFKLKVLQQIRQQKVAPCQLGDGRIDQLETALEGKVKRTNQWNFFLHCKHVMQRMFYCKSFPFRIAISHYMLMGTFLISIVKSS